jgi:hypothetical protein
MDKVKRIILIMIQWNSIIDSVEDKKMDKYIVKLILEKRLWMSTHFQSSFSFLILVFAAHGIKHLGAIL